MQEIVAAANLILTPFKCLCPITCAGQWRQGTETRGMIFHPVASKKENTLC